MSSGQRAASSEQEVAGSSSCPLPAARHPLVIGPYAVQYELARGGMGVVYRAAHIERGHEVALKMPWQEMASVFGFMRREIHALSRLRHPGVVRIFDEGVEKGVPWYAMELLEGRTLEEVLDIGVTRHDETHVLSFDKVDTSGAIVFEMRPKMRTDLPRALTLMYRLARVLAHVHAHGIVHRDLKPKNVVVNADDRPVLVDFGLMGQFRAESGREVLEVGQTAGTAAYISPEQARGELVDARADLYSFGVMLYEIVTGAPPFEGRNVNDVLMAHVKQPPRPPSQLVDGVSPELESLILNLLEKQRGARLGYAEDVAERLVAAGAQPDADVETETAAYLYRPQIVGRDETISTLCARLPEVAKGAGAFVMLGGVSGIGKTSVAAAFAREASFNDFQIVTGECDPVGGQPLHPLRPLLRAIADHCRGRANVIERVLGERLAVLRDLDPSLDALAGEQMQRVPPAAVSRRLFGDLAETIAAFAREQKLLLIVDDLQWADEITLRFLASLGAEFFDGLPLVILGTYRADEAGPDLRALLARDHITKLLLNRLDDGDVAQIVRSMLAAPDVPHNFLHFLAAQTEGNPFFVAEYLRAAVAEQLISRRSGTWHISARDEYGSLALPGTIRDLVDRRLDRLRALAQRIAEAMAVLGRGAPESHLVAMCGETEDDALEGVAELIEQHVFESTADGIRFAHDKLRETAYARIDRDRRRALHRRAAEAIEQRCVDDASRKRHAAELAWHCDSAGLYEKAMGYYARAAEGAVGSGACREAIELMSRAITLDESREGGLRHARWQRVLSFAHFGLGDLPTSGVHARQSLAEVGIHLPTTSMGWRLRLARESMRQAMHLATPPRALRSSQAKQPTLREITMAAQKFSEGRYYSDENTIMLASGLFAVNEAERLGDAPSLIHAYANLGAVMSATGMPRIAARYYEKARRLAIATNDLHGLGHIGYTSAVLYVTNCDWKSCERYFHDAIAAARQAGDPQVIEMNETARGFHELYTGHLTKAADTFTGLRDRAHKRRNAQHEAWGHSWRAGTLILMDRCQEALESIDAAIKLVDALGDNAKLVSYAHRCSAFLHIGNIVDAIFAADVTYTAVSKIPSIIWEKYRGLSAPAEVYLEAWARGIDVERVRKNADVLLRRLQTVARRMPLALPVTLRLTGIKHCLEGNERRGEKLLRKSIAAAQRLGLPIDEAIGEYELARRTGAKNDRARKIFEDIGCELYLRKMEGAST
jgi:serine/threonine protein kinase/tetratricopeptide (TPR) repeat protein